jgi:hypothetical protein
VNLDGTNAAVEFTLPRVELHSGAQGWTCICRCPNGTSRQRSLERAWTTPTAKRAAVAEALTVFGEQYHSALRTLLVG